MQQFQDEKPQETGEDFDKTSAGDVEIGEDEARHVEKEFRRFGESAQKLDAKEITALIDALKKTAEKKEFSESDRQRILNIMRQIDQSEFMISFRKIWDSCPGFLQRAVSSIFGPGPMINQFVRYGFLELKNATEEDIQRRQALDFFIKRLAIKFASVLPEIKPFAPLLEIFVQLEKRGIDFGKISRPYLAQRRAEDETKKTKSRKNV